MTLQFHELLEIIDAGILFGFRLFYRLRVKVDTPQVHDILLRVIDELKIVETCSFNFSTFTILNVRLCLMGISNLVVFDNNRIFVFPDPNIYLISPLTYHMLAPLLLLRNLYFAFDLDFQRHPNDLGRTALNLDPFHILLAQTVDLKEPLSLWYGLGALGLIN